MKIKLLFLIQLMQFLFFSVQAQWIKMNSVDSLSLNSINFVNDSTGFIASCDLSGCDCPSAWSGGNIFKTVDAGVTWNPLQTNGWARPSVFFVDANIGYATGPDLIKTIDGGTTWFYPGPTSGLNSHFAYFINDTVGFINGYNCVSSHSIKRTNDGGINWVYSYFNATSNISSVFFSSAQVGFAVGHDSALILKTIDGGVNWNPVSTLYSLLSVYFPSVNNGYAVGKNGTIIHTIDSGNNWSTQISGTNANLHSIYCLNDNSCYAVGDSGTILKTIDGGNSWVMQNSGTAQELRSIYCTGSHCYVVGDSAVILKTIDGEAGIKNINFNESIVSVFPNPTNNLLSIQNNSNQLLRVSLYNYLGEKIIEKILTEKMSTIDLTGGFKGVYFYKLISDNRIIKSGKIIKE